MALIFGKATKQGQTDQFLAGLSGTNGGGDSVLCRLAVLLHGESLSA